MCAANLPLLSSSSVQCEVCSVQLCTLSYTFLNYFSIHDNSISLSTLFPLIPIVHQFQFYEDCGANHVSLCPLSYTYLLADFLTLSPVCDFSGAQEREENSDSENISDFPSSVRLRLSLTKLHIRDCEINNSNTDWAPPWSMPQNIAPL